MKGAAVMKGPGAEGRVRGGFFVDKTDMSATYGWYLFDKYNVITWFVDCFDA